jgi:hypothetical protein
MRNILLSKIVIMIMIIISVSCNKDTLNEPKVDDQTPKVTTDSSISISAHSSVVYGTINTFGIPCLYYFDYGPTTAYGNESIHMTIDSNLTTLNVSDTLFNLVPTTLYHYRLVSSNYHGISKGNDQEFITTADNAPIVTTDSSNSISAYSEVVYGTINTFGSSCSYYFDYGTTTSYGNESIHKNLDSGLTILMLRDTLFNLVPTTLYHYRIVCSYNYGISKGEDLSFTTVKDDYFPNTSGSQWIYSFYDVVNLRFDTVEVFITNPGTWEYTAYSGLPGYPSYTEGVNVLPNMVQMNSSSSGSRIYLIPFVAGNTWHGPPPQYTFVNYSVTEQDSITTPAGTFYGAFKIRMAAFNGGNTTYIDDRVFVPKVGFVKRNETVTGAGIGTISSYSWNLISFNIIP